MTSAVPASAGCDPFVGQFVQQSCTISTRSMQDAVEDEQTEVAEDVGDLGALDLTKKKKKKKAKVATS